MEPSKGLSRNPGSAKKGGCSLAAFLLASADNFAWRGPVAAAGTAVGQGGPVTGARESRVPAAAGRYTGGKAKGGRVTEPPRVLDRGRAGDTRAVAAAHCSRARECREQQRNGMVPPSSYPKTVATAWWPPEETGET
jgi:hypothetical protein